MGVGAKVSFDSKVGGLMQKSGLVPARKVGVKLKECRTVNAAG